MKYQFYFSEQTGKPCKSFPPLISATYLLGGGAVIPCDLRIHVKDGLEQRILDQVRVAVEAREEKTVFEIKIC